MFLYLTKSDAAEALIPELDKIINETTSSEEPFWSKIDTATLQRAQDEFSKNHALYISFSKAAFIAISFFLVTLAATAVTLVIGRPFASGGGLIIKS